MRFLWVCFLSGESEGVPVTQVCGCYCESPRCCVTGGWDPFMTLPFFMYIFCPGVAGGDDDNDCTSGHPGADSLVDSG